MFRVRAIQVEHGDALLVSYGSEQSLKHMLIDGGPSGSLPNLVEVLDIERGTNDELCLQTLVITHYDLDHIQGVIELLSNKPSWLKIDDIWFNGRDQLHRSDGLGPAAGDKLVSLIAGKHPWNEAFRKQDPYGPRTIQQSCSAIEYGDGLTIHVLSPNEETLEKLSMDWLAMPWEEGSASAPNTDSLGRSDPDTPGSYSEMVADFEPDDSVPNGSSIALLLSFDGKRALLAADAHERVVLQGLERHLPAGESVELLKVSHHGSKANTYLPQLQRINCRRFLISTSGKQHKHPDHALIARLVARHDSPEIIFNYGADRWPSIWKSVPHDWPSFQPTYPKPGDHFVDVLL